MRKRHLSELGKKSEYAQPQQKAKEEQAQTDKNLIEKEQKQMGQLIWKNVCKFTQYSCGNFTFVVVLFCALIPALLNIVVSQWIQYWMKQTDQQKLEMYYPLFFCCLALLFYVASILWGVIISSITLTSSKNLHDHMLEQLLRARVAFFDKNPIGRILSRFSKDIGVADLVLAPVTDYFFQAYARVLTIMILVCYYIPILIVALVILIALLMLVRLKAMKVTNDVMKLQLLSRSPLSTLLGTSVSGLPTIRAYKQDSYFN